jgi:hypothetical protein
MHKRPKPRLKFLHADTALISSKLKQFSREETDKLIDSLVPGKEGALKVREDGTVMDGHHRITILRERGVDVDALPREIVTRHDLSG